MGYRQVDMIIWTPYACVIVEVKGFKSPQSGTVQISVNGEWTIDGEPAALYVSNAGSNPVDQMEKNVFATKNHFQASDIRPDWVHGLILLFPMRGEKLTLKAFDSSSRQKHNDTVNLRDGTDVAVGRLKPLRRYLFDRRGEQRHPLWSAQAVAKAFETLQMTTISPSLEAIVAEGFPREIEHPYRRRSAAAPSPPTAPPRTQPDPPPIANSTPPSAKAAPAAQQSSPVPQRLPAAPAPLVSTSMLGGARPTPIYTNWNTPRTPSSNGAPAPHPNTLPRRKIRVPRRLLKLTLALVIAAASVKVASAFLADRFPETERFQSPSGNLACEITGETSKVPARVTCSAATYFYIPPPSPPDCTVGEFGHAITLTRNIGAHFACTPGPKTAATGILPYGSTTTLDSITCASSTEGVVCTDDTGHGFHIERDTYKLW